MKRIFLFVLGLAVVCIAFVDVTKYAHQWIGELCGNAGVGGLIGIVRYAVFLLTGVLAFPLQLALGSMLCLYAIVRNQRLHSMLSYAIYIDMVVAVLLPILMVAFLWMSASYVNAANAEWLVAKDNLSLGWRGVSGGGEFVAKTTKTVFARMLYWFVVPPLILYMAWRLLRRSLRSFFAGFFVGIKHMT